MLDLFILLNTCFCNDEGFCDNLGRLLISILALCEIGCKDLRFETTKVIS